MGYGDQIYVIRPFLNLDGVYEHHGIDCGDGTVIHYSKRPAEATILCTPIAEFAEDRVIYTRRYRQCYIAATTIQRAQSRLGEQQYNLLFNNCEHFATWCKTGATESQQVRDFVPIVARMQPDSTGRSILESLQGKPDAGVLLDQALQDIRVAWEDLQPRYNEAVREAEAWQAVANQALLQQRDDLARAALLRKRAYLKQAEDFKPQLDHLAQLTRKLIHDRAKYLR